MFNTFHMSNNLFKTKWFSALLALIGFAVDCLAFYPGFISPDSLDQYTQALTHSYSDWHPPIMAGFWSLLLQVSKGGELMFLLQLLCFWTAFYMMMVLLIKHTPQLVYLIPLLFLAPFIQNFVGNIWKDIGLAISWLLAVAIILGAYFNKRSLSRPEAVITIILLSYGCWIRINALPGVVPLLSLWLFAVKKNSEAPIAFKKLALTTLALTALLLAVQLSITRLILKPIKTFPEYKLFVHDLTGIYKSTGQLYFPEFITSHAGFDSLYIKEKYIYSTFDNIWWNNDGKTILPSANSEQMYELQTCWMKAILKHPAAYLKNRIKGFLNFLRITDSGSQLAITYNYIHPNQYGLAFKSNRLTNLVRSFVETQRPMFYMQPWFWIVLNLIVLVLAHRSRFSGVKIPALCLGYSSLLYLVLEFVVYQADTEFRYFYWNCVAVSLAALLLAMQHNLNKQAQNKSANA